MGKGKPYSDAEIRPETPEILRHLEKVHYKSREWNRGVDVGNRGTGNVEIEDQYADDGAPRRRGEESVM